MKVPFVERRQGICLGLGGMKVGGSRRVSLPASSRTGWGSIDTIPDDVGHIVGSFVRLSYRLFRANPPSQN